MSGQWAGNTEMPNSAWSLGSGHGPAAAGWFAFKLEQVYSYSGLSLPELVLQRPQGGL